MTAPDFLPILSAGAHRSPKEGACVMEYVSLLAGEPWTDHPKCTHPALATLAIRLNDSLDDEHRQVLLPLIPRLIGTATDDPHVHVAISVALLRVTYRDFWPSWARELEPAWRVLDRWARQPETVTTDDLAAAVAAVVAVAATATAVAATATATAAAAAAAAVAVAAAATATAAAAAAAAAAAVAAAVAVVAVYGGYLRDALVAALDAHDDVTGRARSDLTETQWRDLAAAVR